MPAVEWRGLSLTDPFRYRPESFGAMIALDSPSALVAVDRTKARALGIDGGEVWEHPDQGLDIDRFQAPNEVHLAVTARCPVGCQGCYMDARPDRHHPTFEELASRLRSLLTRSLPSGLRRRRGVAPR